MSKKTGDYPFIKCLISDWKPRAKKIKVNLKDIAKDAGVSPQHMTQLVQGNVQNPRLQTVNDVEMAFRNKEKGV